MDSSEKINMYLLIPLLLFIIVFVLQNRANAEMKHPPTEKINVFAVVSPEIEDAFKDAARFLEQTEGIVSFPLEGLQVHCTLYMTQYPEGIKEEILKKVSEMANTTKAFPVNSTGLEITSGNWFFMNLDRNRNLQTLSDKIVETLSQIRAKSDFVPAWAKSFPAKLEYIAKYGSPNVYTEFNPHLTFTAPSDGEKLKRFVENHKDKPFAKTLEGKVVAIGVGIADRNGQIPEPWKIFPLKNDEKGKAKLD